MTSAKVNPVLSETDKARLEVLNYALRLITAEMKELGLQQCRILEAKMESEQDALAGFRIRADVAFESRKQNPYYLWDDPNYLVHAASLNLDFHKPGAESHWEGDMEFSHDRPDELAGMAPCWLMHELYKSKEAEEVSHSMNDMLSIDTISVRVQTSQTFVYDLSRQAWIRNPPELVDDDEGDWY